MKNILWCTAEILSFAVFLFCMFGINYKSDLDFIIYFIIPGTVFLSIHCVFINLPDDDDDDNEYKKMIKEAEIIANSEIYTKEKP
jgi:hypothetical protein